MSRYLWKSFLEDDVDNFRQLLGDGDAFTSSKVPRAGSYGVSFNSPGGVSPILQAKNKDAREKIAVSVSRTEVNSRDSKGLTILHHAASSNAETALHFALALLAHPWIDLYLQDFENGWTALHRAFYFGNISIARAIIERDAPGSSNHCGGSSQISSLIKVKDREGHSPYDLLATTIGDRSLRSYEDGSDSDDDSSSNDQGANNGTYDQEGGSPSAVSPSINVRADEMFTFGSNRNLSLGFGDQDDRHFPEKILLRRPKRLFDKLHKEHVMRLALSYRDTNLTYAERIRSQFHTPKDLRDLPNIVRQRPLLIQDVQMSKFHTAVLTNDPLANLYVCGHGVGGRLGTGNERTLFNFACLDEFGSAHVVAVALGQDHTLAVTNRGELYAWGNNIHGQLGCGLSKDNPKPEDCLQLSPKQIFGPMKKEVILGIAASRIHSVAYTHNALFTFGKNEGQLGLVDSQAGTLKIQSTPRQVQASRLSSSISAVTAIDRATVVLLENNEVHVFANYGAVKLQFPLEGFSNYFLRQSFRATKYNKTPNTICKVTGGGDTICALSTSGEVYTVTVNQRLDPSASSNTSTTNPKQIRAALSAPYRAWALRSDRTAARDVGVDADGSIILATEAGAVFRRIRRPKTAGAGSRTIPNHDQKSKEFKFMRVLNLTRAVAVRASASGGYCALREDCNVTKTELDEGPKALWQDIFGLLSYRALAEDSPAPSFWQRPDAIKRLVERVSRSEDVETEVANTLRKNQAHWGSCDVLLRSSASEYAIPAHKVVLGGRSSIFRAALASAAHGKNYNCETFSLKPGPEGKLILTFAGIDFLALFEISLYLYTDALVGFWRLRHRSPQMAFRYKQVRTELMKVAVKLDLKNLEVAARKQIIRPDLSMSADFQLALLDSNFYANTDARIQLADGELLVHSTILSKRCPFFEGLFQGAASGTWLTGRRGNSGFPSDLIDVDLSHVELGVFKLILRYLYADTGRELFDDVVVADTEEFLDLVLEVLSVANELMLDNLSRTCQAILGEHVTTRNVCQLLNVIAPNAITDLKNVALEYMCLSLEPLLANHWLDELDEDLLEELDKVVRENQRAVLPIVRSGRMEAQLFEEHPELAEVLDRARQAKIDALDIKAKFPDIGSPTFVKSRPSPNLQARKSSKASPQVAASALDTITPDLKELESLPPAAKTVSHEEQQPTHSPTVLDATENKPWGSSRPNQVGVGLRDIMAQTSSSRTSNLSLGLGRPESGERKVSAPATPKVSQKERKRQQQQQQQRPAELLHDTSPVPGPSGLAASSPWKIVAPAQKPSPVRAGSDASTAPSGVSPASARSPSTPHLTMRQTVANAPIPKQKEKALAPPSTPPQNKRSISMPLPIASSRPSPMTPDSPEIQIQSIRHQPRPSESPTDLSGQSLADIMSREQAQKVTIKDAAAKRSLQEIQEEQAFQEWWDKESLAVQEAQQRAEGGSSSRGRGSGRVRGRGRSRRGKQRSETTPESSAKAT